MSGIAEVLLAHGFEVSGSDLSRGDTVVRLEELGATVRQGHQAEHVAGADSSFGYSPQTVLWLTQVLPQAVALVATLYWGRLFDRFNFLAIRIALNLFFASSILCFFTPWLSMQVFGSTLLGVAQGVGCCSGACG